MAKKIRKHVRRKDLLKEQDEFISVTEKAVNWSMANWPLVIIAVAIVAAAGLVGLMLSSSAANARREFYISFEDAIDTVDAPIQGEDNPSISSATAIYPDETQKYEAAVFKLEKLLTENSDSTLAPFMKLYISYSNLKLQNYEEAISGFDILAKSAPTGGDIAILAKHNEGMAYYLQEKYDMAYTIFKELTETETPFMKASSLVYAGRSAEHLGKTEEAISFFQRAVDSYSDSVITNGLKNKIAKLNIKLESVEEEEGADENEQPAEP